MNRRTSVQPAMVLMALLGVGGAYLGVQQAGTVVQQVPQARRLELTKVDLFAVNDWDSRAVTVLGFGLGMSREDATTNAGVQGLRLLTADVVTQMTQLTCSKGDCSVYSRDLWKGIELRFGPDDRIREVEVSRSVWGDQAVMRASVTRQFIGNTALLFNRYSNDLRLKLLGPESTREASSIRVGYWATYTYPHRGLRLFVNGNSQRPESEADVTMTFMAPDRSSVK